MECAIRIKSYDTDGRSLRDEEVIHVTPLTTQQYYLRYNDDPLLKT